MPPRKTTVLTEFEMEVMKALWEKGDATVPELVDALAKGGPRVAQVTVRTMLGILRKKGYVGREEARRGFVYRPLISQEQTHRRVLQSLIERVFDGSALDLVSALVRGDLVSQDDIRKVRQMVREKDKRSRP